MSSPGTGVSATDKKKHDHPHRARHYPGIVDRYNEWPYFQGPRYYLRILIYWVLLFLPDNSKLILLVPKSKLRDTNINTLQYLGWRYTQTLFISFCYFKLNYNCMIKKGLSEIYLGLEAKLRGTNIPRNSNNLFFNYYLATHQHVWLM